MNLLVGGILCDGAAERKVVAVHAGLIAMRKRSGKNWIRIDDPAAVPQLKRQGDGKAGGNRRASQRIGTESSAQTYQSPSEYVMACPQVIARPSNVLDR